MTPTETDSVCPNAGTKLRRDLRPMTLAYKGKSVTFDMPGLVLRQLRRERSYRSRHEFSDRALNLLKARVEANNLAQFNMLPSRWRLITKCVVPSLMTRASCLGLNNIMKSKS